MEHGDGALYICLEEGTHRQPLFIPHRLPIERSYDRKVGVGTRSRACLLRSHPATDSFRDGGDQ